MAALKPHHITLLFKEMRLKKPTLKMWRYVTTDEQVQWLLAPNLEHALWAAAELSGGSSKLKDVYLDNDEW